MVEGEKAAKPVRRRNPFQELMAGVEAMREHREGRLTLRSTELAPIKDAANPMDIPSDPSKF